MCSFIGLLVFSRVNGTFISVQWSFVCHNGGPLVLFINRLVLFRLWALMCVFGLIQFEVCLLVKVGVLVLLGKDEI